MSMIVRCYVERRGDDWEAVCIDFDLAVQGHSFPEVRERLDQAIHDYLSYVESLPEAERGAFLNRRVPLGTRLAFAFRVLVSALHSSGRGDHRGAAYTLPCAA